MIERLAMLSLHTSPLATLGGKKTGGMNVYVRELARELSRRGIAVDVFTRQVAPHVPCEIEPMAARARLIHVPAGPPVTLDPDQLFPYLAEFTAGILRYAESNDLHYDAIYSHYWLSGVAAHTLRANWRVPTAQMFHTLGLMKARILPESEDSARPLDRPVDLRSFNEADIMSWADAIIAATPAEKTQMLWLYRAPRRRIEIVPPGVDLARFHPMAQAEARRTLGLETHCRMLLFVGRIEPLKGVDSILEALALLKQESPALTAGVCLSIIGGEPDAVGENAEMDRLKALRHTLGLEDLVLFLGAKDQDTLNYYYAASEALIMPSDYESFGMVALEAMASGTPVIASNVGGLAFLVRDGENGYHVPVREPRALADKIRLLLESPAVRARLATQAAEDARAYAWSHIADRLLALFDELRLMKAHPAIRQP